MPLILAFIAVFVVGGIAGAIVMNWKEGAEIEKLTSNISVLLAANDKCATDIVAVKESITAITKAATERAKAASVSMVVASKVADTHTAKARQIRTYPPVQIGMQCDAV